MRQHYESKVKWLWVKWGSISALFMIGFFLLMKAFDLHTVLELRFVNLVFACAAVYLTLRQHKKMVGLPYLVGLWDGIRTAFMNGIVFAVFMVIYITFIEPEFMEYLVQHAPLGQYLHPRMVAGATFTETFSMGCVFTMVFMPYFQSNRSETV